MIYDEIYNFCKVRNSGSIRYNKKNDLTPRVKFVIELLKKHNIDYELRRYDFYDTIGVNIVMKGSSDKIIVAHHDIVNPDIDNANDNSCSVINSIALKLLYPDLNVVLTDGEECGGTGAQSLADDVNKGLFGNIKYILNLELTGSGGSNFFIGSCESLLGDKIKEMFNCQSMSVPFNDSVIFRLNNIDSVVINPLPITNEITRVSYNGEYLNESILYNCHSSRDTLDTISTSDMKEFTEKVLLKIVKNI